jgi:hypothetical protein
MLVLAFVAGCVSKNNAQLQARMAYLAGQQAAIAQAQQQAQGPTVRVQGQVKYPVIAWTEGMTLARALVSAQYASNTDPGAIIIRRAGQEIPINLQRFYAGDDYPVEAGDVIELVSPAPQINRSAPGYFNANPAVK